MLLKMENSSKKIHNALQEDFANGRGNELWRSGNISGKNPDFYTKAIKTGMKDGFCQRELWKKERNIMKRLSVR